MVGTWKNLNPGPRDSLVETYRIVVQSAVVQNCQVDGQEGLQSSPAELITTAGISLKENSFSFSFTLPLLTDLLPRV